MEMWWLMKMCCLLPNTRTREVKTKSPKRQVLLREKNYPEVQTPGKQNFVLVPN